MVFNLSSTTKFLATGISAELLWFKFFLSFMIVITVYLIFSISFLLFKIIKKQILKKLSSTLDIDHSSE